MLKVLFLVVSSLFVSSPVFANGLFYKNERPVPTNADQTMQLEIFESFLSALVDGDTDRWLTLWHEDAVFKIPYAPEGYIREIKGLGDIRRYISSFPEEIDYHAFHDIEVFFVANRPDVIVAEFVGESKLLEKNVKFRPYYISVLIFKEGKLKELRDFWDPLYALKAFGGEETLLSLPGGQLNKQNQ